MGSPIPTVVRVSDKAEAGQVHFKFDRFPEIL